MTTSHLIELPTQLILADTDSARPKIPPDEPCAPAQNAQFWLMLQVAYLIWQVCSLAVSQDLVNCGLG